MELLQKDSICLFYSIALRTVWPSSFDVMCKGFNCFFVQLPLEPYLHHSVIRLKNAFFLALGNWFFFFIYKDIINSYIMLKTGLVE